MIGSGIKSKGSEAVMTLACNGTLNAITHQADCDSVRIIYISPDRTAGFWVGPSFEVKSKNEVPSERDFKNAAKSIRKRYHRWVVADPSAMRKSPAARLGLIIGVSGFALATTAMIATSNPICMAVWIPVVFGVNAIRKKQFDFGITDTNRAGTWTTFSTQEGWNWAEKPRRVSTKTFDGFLEYLETQSGGIPDKFKADKPKASSDREKDDYGN